METISNTRVHLVLSSGGAKCISYAGAIAELVRNGISFASISACSAGSIVGAMLSTGLSAADLEKKVFDLDFRSFFSGKRFPVLWKLTYPFSRYKHSMVSEVFCELVNANPTFEELTIPFATIGIDLITKRFLVYSKKTNPGMLVSEALKIASAVPARTPPYRPPGRCVVDAAIATESPVWLATDYDDDLPIIVLRPSKKVDIHAPDKLNTFIASLIISGAESHDHQLLNQIPGVRIITIDCGDVDALNFNISKEQKTF